MSFVEEGINEVGDFIGDHGAAVGTAAGIAAAPFTGGLSLAGGAALGGSLGALGQSILADSPDTDIGSSLDDRLEGLEMPSMEIPEFEIPNFDFSSPFSGEVQKVLDQFGSARGQIDPTLSSVRDLQSRFEPGFSDIRNARLDAVSDARRRGLSNLRESLNRRNVLGSSFASDTMSRARREFARERASQAAKSFREEIAATMSALEQERQLISTDLQALANQGQLASSAFSTDVQRQASEKGLAVESATAQSELAIAAQRAQQQFFSDMQQTAVDAERISAELAAAESAGRGQLTGTAIGGLTDFLAAQNVGDSGGSTGFTNPFAGTGEIEAGTGNRAVPFLNSFSL